MSSTKQRFRRRPTQSWTPTMPKMKNTKKQSNSTLPSMGSVSSSRVTRMRIPAREGKGEDKVSTTWLQWASVHMLFCGSAVSYLTKRALILLWNAIKNNCTVCVCFDLRKCDLYLHCRFFFCGVYFIHTQAQNKTSLSSTSTTVRNTRKIVWKSSRNYI